MEQTLSPSREHSTAAENTQLKPEATQPTEPFAVANGANTQPQRKTLNRSRGHSTQAGGHSTHRTICGSQWSKHSAPAEDTQPQQRTLNSSRRPLNPQNHLR